MARVKRGVTSHAKHKKTLKAAKGFYGRRKNTIRAAKAAVDRSMQYAYRDRKNKKRSFRALWIQRLNASVREHGLVYSVFINGLHKAGIEDGHRRRRLLHGGGRGGQGRAGRRAAGPGRLSFRASTRYGQRPAAMPAFFCLISGLGKRGEPSPAGMGFGTTNRAFLNSVRSGKPS